MSLSLRVICVIITIYKNTKYQDNLQVKLQFFLNQILNFCQLNRFHDMFLQLATINYVL